MDDGHYRKRLITTVGVLAGVLAVGLLFVTLSSFGRDLVGGPGSMMGWAVPLVGLFIIAAITWLLILEDTHSDADPAQRVSCWACGHSIMSEWRLCPYCGAEARAWTPMTGESLHRG